MTFLGSFTSLSVPAPTVTLVLWACLVCVGVMAELPYSAAAVASANVTQLQSALHRGRTFAYAVEGVERVTSRSHASMYNAYGTGASYAAGADAITILTPEENQRVVALLRAYNTTAERLPTDIPDPKQPFPADLTLDTFTYNYILRPKAYLKASFVKECPHALLLCCRAYWRGDNLEDRLPEAKVPPENFFWDGNKTINGYFTNFSLAYLEARDCATSLHSTSLAVDMNGEWRIITEHSSNTLRQFDLTDYLGKPANETGLSDTERWFREQAAAARELLGEDPEAYLRIASPPTSSLSVGIGIIPAVVVPSVLLVVLLFLLALFYALDYHPRRKRIQSLRQQYPEAAAWVSERGGSDHSGSADGTERGASAAGKQQKPLRSRRRSQASRRGSQQGGDAYMESASSSSTAASSAASSRSPSPSLTNIVDRPAKPSPSPWNTTNTASSPSRSPSHGQQQQPQTPRGGLPRSPSATNGLRRTGSSGSMRGTSPTALTRARTSSGGGGTGSGYNRTASPLRNPMMAATMSPQQMGSFHGHPTGGMVMMVPMGAPPGPMLSRQGSFTQGMMLPALPPPPTMVPGGGLVPSPLPQGAFPAAPVHPGMLPRTASFGSMVSSHNASFNSASATRAFPGHPGMTQLPPHQTQQQQQQQQQQQKLPSPTATSPTSILVKQSSFRRDDATTSPTSFRRSNSGVQGGGGREARRVASFHDLTTTPSPSSSAGSGGRAAAPMASSAPPPRSLTLSAPPRQSPATQHTLAGSAHGSRASSSSGRASREDRSPTRTPGGTSARLDPGSRPNPFKLRESFRKV